MDDKTMRAYIRTCQMSQKEFSWTDVLSLSLIQPVFITIIVVVVVVSFNLICSHFPPFPSFFLGTEYYWVARSRALCMQHQNKKHKIVMYSGCLLLYLAESSSGLSV
jgi:hypothetical protein